MKTLISFIKRNVKMFFKDKGLFFTSLITPLILLLLYCTFLSNVYKDSFLSSIEEAKKLYNMPDFTVSQKNINGVVGGQLFASLLAVSCITVSFCSNMLMVQDKINGQAKDFAVSPVKKTTLAVGYYIGTILNALIISVVAMIAGFVYIAIIGWCLSVIDVIMITVDILLLVFFGTALSSIVNFFLSTQGQVSAVGTLISSCYGFICGAYMPISQFGKGLQNVLSLLPSTYATATIKYHSLRGAMSALEADGIPAEIVSGIQQSVDCKVNFFGHTVSPIVSFLILLLTDIALIIAYVLINRFAKSKAKNA